MPLTSANYTTLKNHITANTNTIGGTAINVLPNNSDTNADIANWYNQLITGSENQTFTTPTLIWRPVVTIGQMNSAIVWSANPAGVLSGDIANSWLKWQSMTWANMVDMTDTQVRQGIDEVWGVGSQTATNLKANGVGRQAGTRAEHLFAGAGGGGARVSTFFGQLLTGSDVETARNLA